MDTKCYVIPIHCSVQSLSHVRLFVTPCITARQASLSITNSRSSPKHMFIKSVMPSNHSSSAVPFSSHLQSFPASGYFPMSQLFTKSWKFRFSISPSNEYLGLISFRIDWLDLLAVQGTLKSLLQYHSSKASILRHSAFFIVQLSHSYMTTGKTIALTRWTFVGKVLSVLFNMVSRLIGEGNGNPLQCSCLENPRDGGAWWAAVYGVTQSQTRLKQLSSSSSSCDIAYGTSGILIHIIKYIFLNWLADVKYIAQKQNIKIYIFSFILGASLYILNINLLRGVCMQLFYACMPVAF